MEEDNPFAAEEAEAAREEQHFAEIERVSTQLKNLGFKRRSLEVGRDRFTKLLPIRTLERICTTEAILTQELEDAAEGIVVIEFVAGWCESCEFIYSPRITRVAEKIARGSDLDIVFLKVDVDRTPGAAEAFDVQYTPTFVFFRDGDEIGRFAGHSHRHFEEALAGLVDDDEWDEEAIPRSQDVRPFYHHHPIGETLPPAAEHRLVTRDTNPLYLTTSRAGFGAAGNYAFNRSFRPDRLMK
jgi:thioredoxin 1